MQNTNIKTDIKIIQASPTDLDAVTAVEAVCFPAAEAAGRQSFALKNKPIELIVEELDRLGRNADLIKKELMWFKEHNIIVRILEIPIFFW